MSDNTERIRKEKMKERKIVEEKLKKHFGNRFKGFQVKREEEVMQEVKAGIEKGWCDESEMEKVNQLMAMAQNKMGQVEDREATPEEENMFALASLM